ncbi:hypothetical protein ACFLYK_02740 [Candidatus Cloacimonadota bacterium]
MQRLLILGNAGSGKTYLAKKIAAILLLEAIHLDYYFWQPGWKIPDRKVWIKQITEMVKRERWVMDGNYCSVLDLRLKYADTIIFIEQDRITCLFRCFHRFLKFHGRSRPDLNKGCPETFDLDFAKWIWNYSRNEKPEIFKIISQHQDITLIILKGKKGIVRFLRKMKLKRGI